MRALTNFRILILTYILKLSRWEFSKHNKPCIFDILLCNWTATSHMWSLLLCTSCRAHPIQYSTKIMQAICHSVQLLTVWLYLTSSLASNLFRSESHQTPVESHWMWYELRATSGNRGWFAHSIGCRSATINGIIDRIPRRMETCITARGGHIRNWINWFIIS